VALNIDVDRGLRRPADLVKLVEAVVAGKDEDEADWVEWKSTLDLATPKGTFNLARQILGSAHRHPEQAARFMQGLGYVIVGAEPGSVEGVSPVDLAKLDASLETYLGSPGPVWGGVYVELQGKDVLVVTVEGPRWGDRFYPLAKTYQGQGKSSGADAGTIFVRKQARTVPAGPGDIDMLQDRLVRGHQENQSLELVVDWPAEPAELVALDMTSDTLDEWLDHRRGAVLAMEPLKRKRMEGENPVGAMLAETMTRDRRTREEYLQEVDAHLAKCRKAVKSGMLDKAAGRRLNLVALRVTNPTERNLPDVELTLRIDARAVAFEEDREHDWELPKPPKAFGTPGKSLIWGLQSEALVGPLPVFYPRLLLPKPLRLNRKITIDSGNFITIELSLGDIRPKGVRTAEPFLLLVTEEPRSTVNIAWSATSTRVDARQEGALALLVGDEALTPLDLIPYAADTGSRDEE
jgi:hypothetical protein